MVANALTRLRTMRDEDVEACHALSTAVGWPHRADDWRFAMNVGEGIVAMLNGDIVGTGMVWKFGENHATIGMIIVSPALQGLGVGWQIVDWLVQQAGPRVVMLNATAAGEPLYAKFGFEKSGEVEQFHRIAVAHACSKWIAQTQVELAEGNEADAIQSLDRNATGMDRKTLLTSIVSLGEAAVARRHGRITGYSTCRMFGRGRAVGPVIASGSADARDLIAYWISRYPSEFIRIDITSASGLGEWLRSQGFKPASRAASMIRGDRPEEHPDLRIFALASQAFN
ncbi:GNAT family N-acetyltransferase [Rhizobium daejeonense]|uniref:GNAT family N-acetyltransferase n=1 Tax=Rhizobium daejeonense TaxID=240521 RepID=A0A6M1RW24_9HYPH|nr:GNAT family N-acetyltransferase [Rhizobium daejeonense]NGO65934.1 GNAT family N-acetyltransferase [Rhizobium daejeonense]